MIRGERKRCGECGVIQGRTHLPGCAPRTAAEVGPWLKAMYALGLLKPPSYTIRSPYDRRRS